MIRWSSALTVLLVFGLGIAAQNAPLTAEDIFSPSVAIRHVPLDVPVSDVAADDSMRLMSLGGRTIPYPEDFETVVEIEKLDSARYLVTNRIDSPTDPVWKRWLYDATADTLVEFTGQCDGRGITRYLHAIATQPWTILAMDGGSQLCNVLTGERIPLPTDRADFSYFYMEAWDSDDGILEESPDGRFLLVTGYEYSASQQRYSGNDLMYSYEFATKQFRTLGSLALNGVFSGVNRWLTATVFALTSTEPMGVDSTSLYIGDALQADSLEFVLGTNDNYPVFYDNPPRYVVENTSGMGEVLCGKTVYDVTTGELRHYGRGGCRPEYGTFEAVGYYRDVPSAGTTECCQPRPVEVAETAVIRYDERTGESRELYRGEVEQIAWVSSDDRYSVLLLDNNGIVSDYPYLDMFFDGGYGDTQWALVDLDTGETLHTVPNVRLAFRSHPYDYEDAMAYLGIFPLADGSFVTNSCVALETTCDVEISERIVLNGGEPIVTVLEVNPLLALPDQTRVVVESRDGGRTGLDLYDAATGERSQLVEPLDASYELRKGLRDDGTLVISITQPEARYPTSFEVTFDVDGTPVVVIDDVPSEIVLDAAAATPVVVVSAIPSLTPTASWTPPPPPTPVTSCGLTVINDANLRNFPNANPESGSIVVGSAATGFVLTATSRFNNRDDGFIWWKLSTGEWLREDFVDEGEFCERLRSITEDSQAYFFITPTPTLAPSTTPTAMPTRTPTAFPACMLMVITGANLRAEPSAGSVHAGSVTVDIELIAIGQYTSTEDFFTWWKLETGEWIREDFVLEAESCTNLAFIDPLDPEFIFVTPTPSATATTSITATIPMSPTPIAAASCILTIITGTNLRAGPGVDFERVGSAAVDFTLTATGQAENAQDFFTWWQLDTGEWIREDFVREGDGCDALPIIQP